MKTTLKFDLNELEDIKDHRRCIKALDMACVLFEFQLNSKKAFLIEIDKDLNLSKYDVIDLVYERFNKIMEEYNIHLDELID